MTFPFCSRCGRRLPAPSASPRQCAGCQLSHPDPVTSIYDRKQTTMQTNAYTPDARAARLDLAHEIRALLFPELYPPGSEYHDPTHVYWDDELLDMAARCEELPPHQWSSDEIEWVAELVQGVTEADS